MRINGYKLGLLPLLVGLNWNIRDLLSVRKHQRDGTDGTIVTEVFGRSFTIRAHAPDIHVLAALRGEEMKAARQVSHLPFDVVIDAGAYIGTTGLLFAQAFPSARVICLEPHDGNKALLEINLAGIPNVSVRSEALVPDQMVQSNQVDFSLKNRGTGDWGYSIVPRPADKPDAVTIQNVKGISLKKLIDEIWFAKRDPRILLKLDIEGAESLLLESGDLDHHAIQAIIIEIHEGIVPGLSKRILRWSSENFRRISQHGEKFVLTERKLEGDRQS